MARGRFISTSIAEDDRLSKLSITAELLYLKTIPHLDRDGMITGRAGALWGRVCPLREDLMPEMQKSIDEWITVGLVVRMTTDKGPVLFFPGFLKNNTLLHYDRETPSQFPVPPGYERTEMGLVLEGTEQRKKPTKKPKEAQVPPSSNGNGAGIIDSVNAPVIDEVIDFASEVKVEVKDQVEDQEGEGDHARTQPPPPPDVPVILHSRNATNGATNKLVFSSPHVDNSKLTNGYVPPGKGTTAVEIYYERFDVCHNDQRLTDPQEDDLVRLCPDLMLLREVVTAYSRAGFKTMRNIKLILDWYKDPSRFRGSQNGTGRGHSTAHSGQADGGDTPQLDPDIQRRMDEHRAKRKAEGSPYYQ